MCYDMGTIGRTSRTRNGTSLGSVTNQKRITLAGRISVVIRYSLMDKATNNHWITR